MSFDLLPIYYFPTCSNLRRVSSAELFILKGYNEPCPQRVLSTLTFSKRPMRLLGMVDFHRNFLFGRWGNRRDPPAPWLLIFISQRGWVSGDWTISSSPTQLGETASFLESKPNHENLPNGVICSRVLLILKKGNINPCAQYSHWWHYRVFFSSRRPIARWFIILAAE